MKNPVLKKIVAVSMATALLCAVSPSSVKAAMEVTVSDAPVAESLPAEPAVPVVPASDFSNPSAAPAAISASPNTLVIPEPGTMFAGFGVLTYLLLKSGRRTRSR